MVKTPSSASRFARDTASRSMASSPLMHFAAAAALCAAFTFPSFAQSPAPTTSNQELSTPQAQPGHRSAESTEMRQQKREKRKAQRTQGLAHLHQQLALDPAQETAWSSFEQAMQPQSGRTARLDMHGMENLTTPERIDRMRAMRAQRAAAMDARGDATKAFYGQLQPEQQKTFDHASLGLMQHGHRMGHRADHNGKAHGAENAG